MEVKKPPCPYCPETVEQKIKSNGSYTVNKGDKVVRRFLCGNCGNGFTPHLRLQPDWNYQREVKVFRKLKSQHNQEREAELFKRIDDAIIEKGFFEVAKMKRRLKIGTTTYYRYLSQLTRRLLWSGEIQHVWENLILDRAVLLELKTRLKKDPKSDADPSKTRRETLRVFILFDKETHLAYDFFLVRKKKQYRFKNFDEDRFFGHVFMTSEMLTHLKNLKARYPRLVIEVDCHPTLRKTLIERSPELFVASPKRYFASFWNELEKFKMRRNLSFNWTLTSKKLEENPNAFISQVGELQTNLKSLLSVYNRHHLLRLEKSGINLRNKKSTSAKTPTSKIAFG